MGLAPSCGRERCTTAPSPALPPTQAEFSALAADLARQYPDRARLWFAYNEPLSHLVYAGADMLLVPSMFEPCGLTQVGRLAGEEGRGASADERFVLNPGAQRPVGDAAGQSPRGWN